MLTRRWLLAFAASVALAYLVGAATEAAHRGEDPTVDNEEDQE